jgi:hypothetical protein
MNFLSFGRDRLNIISAPGEAQSVLASLAHSGRSTFAVDLPDCANQYDSNGIVPDFSGIHQEFRNVFSATRPNGGNFWATKIKLKDYVNVLYDLSILGPKTWEDKSAEERVFLWAKNMLEPLFLDAFGPSLDPIMGGVSWERPGQRTTSVNKRTGKKVGLHIDTFEMVPIKDRLKEKYRCVVNIGTQPRKFIFDPRSGFEILSEIREQNCKDDFGSQSPTTALRIASGKFPLELYSMTVHPGEAYIAPTEVIPHDASTFKNQGNGATYTFRGHFQLDRLPYLWERLH